MEILQIKDLSLGDRFAKKDWMQSPENRVNYRVENDIKPCRKTVDVLCESTGKRTRVKKESFVYKLGGGETDVN